MSRFPRGCQPDPQSHTYAQHTALIAAIPPVLSAANLYPYRNGLVWQGSWAECVACSIKRAIQLWHAANGYGREVLISDTFAYAIGRAEEFAGVDPDRAPPLQDRGAKPSLVLLATQQLGMLRDVDYPGPSFPDFDPMIMFRRPPPDVLVNAYDARGLDFFDIPKGARPRSAIRDCMVRRQPVMFAMFVDKAFEDNAGEVVDYIDRADPEGGLHMMCVLDASDDKYLQFDNWWRNDQQGCAWGAADGTGLMTWNLFEAQVDQILAVRAAPVQERS